MATPATSAAGDAPIGGFFGLEAARSGKPDIGSPHVLFFWNARAALAHLLRQRAGAGRVWFPAYICADAVSAAADREVAYYPVGAQLRGGPEAAPGDVVVGVDYFGARAEGIAPQPGVTRVQDRAQGLWPAADAWGDHLIYSARKVIGAPDGGMLVTRDGPPAAPTWAADPDQSRLEPARMRAADPLARDNAAWFPAYRAAEAAMSPAPIPISEVSRSVIAGADTAALAATRRRNAQVLLEAVGDHALFDADRLLAGTPLGVPVLTADAGKVAARMAARRIFCARHWAELPSPAAAFPAEHALSRRLLTLPCDHRYGEADMARVAEAFLASA